jgi:type I restriction enzyme, S subunit
MTAAIGDLIVEYIQRPGVGDELPVLTLTEHRGFVYQSDRFHKRLATADTSKYKVVRRDDIAFNPYLLWAGAVARNTIVDEGIISPLYPTFRVREGFDPSYVARVLLSSELVALYDSIAFGSVPRRRRSSVADFLSLELPWSPPELEKQRRVAAILDQAATLRAKRRLALAHLDSLTSSVFDQMFSRETPKMRLGELATTSSGGTPNRSIPGFYGGGIPWVKSGELHTHLILSTEETLTPLGLANSSANLLNAGTILIAMYGATAGVVSRLGVSAATNQAVCAIEPGPRVESSFLIAALRSMSKQLLSLRSGGAQPNLSQAKLRGLEIPVPTRELQSTFSVRAEALEAYRSRSREVLVAEAGLLASLESRAFRGEL